MPFSAPSAHRDEAERLKALLQYEVLDTAPDPALEEVVRLAAQITRAPYAYIGFLDSNRLWLAARTGFEQREMPRAATACQYTVFEQRTQLINDTANDAALPAGSTLELAPGLYCRSYLGAPLIVPSGAAIGTLAVLAPAPGAFEAQHAKALEILARQVVTRLELNSRDRQQERTVRSHQRMERALIAERNFVSAVLDTVSALVLVVDAGGRIVRFNRACERISGYSFAELVGRPLPEEIFFPEERENARELFEQARQGATQQSREIHWIGRDSKRRRIAWTAAPLANPNGEVNFVIATGADVTAQREAELALRCSEARYRQLVEGSLGMVCTHDMEGRLLSINGHAAENLGYSEEELIGRLVTDFIPEEYKDGWAAYAQAIRERGEERGRLYLRHKQGGVRVIAYRNNLIDLPETEPFVLGHGIDVTEKTDAENRLHALMRQRESILESVGDGIYGTDFEGRIIFVNKIGAKMLGYTPEEVEGRPIHELIHHTRADGSPYPERECVIRSMAGSSVPMRVRDEVFWRKDGTSIPVEYVACPLITNGKAAGTVVAFQDVTESRRLDRMKDEFISTVSHELRTPLTSLRAALGLIGGGVLDRRPEKLAQMLNMAVGNCDRLVRLVNDILDFERIHSGTLNLVYSEVNAFDLLRHAADLQHPSATRARIRFRIDAEPVELWIDKERILQTLDNLIGNSIKFSPPGTEIRLRARRLNDTQAVIEVEDQGRGIPAEKLDVIFERFQQVDASDSRAMGGTGLGLAICRSIVRQHGGRIWATSTPGEGSTFLLTVPLHTVVQQERSATPIWE